MSLKDIVPVDDNTWELFENVKEIREPFFVLFKATKPYEKYLALPNTIKNFDENVVFVKEKQLERDIVKLNNDDVVTNFLFKPYIGFSEPVAVFSVEGTSDNDLNSLLKRIIKRKHVVQKV